MGKSILWTSCALAWASAAALGFASLWTYSNAPGKSAAAPRQWPAHIAITRSRNTPMLVLLLHPHCPCSRATVEELSKLVAHCDRRLSVIVLMNRPSAAPADWEKTDLWRAAADIPNVSVIADIGGELARKFQAHTSGQALLYSTDGSLLFSGGITEARGHMGDNPGRSTIVDLVLKQPIPGKDVARTPVFGCPLFAEGETTCTK